MERNSSRRRECLNNNRVALNEKENKKDQTHDKTRNKGNRDVVGTSSSLANKKDMSCTISAVPPPVETSPILPTIAYTRNLRHCESFFVNELKRHVTEFHDYHGPMIHIPPTEEEVGFTIDDVCLYRNLSISQEKITDLLIQALYLTQDHHHHHHHEST
jgi:hypothetical protein